MPRPATKFELISLANEGFDKLWSLIDSMTEKEQDAPFVFDVSDKKEAHWRRDRNLRDVLIHLYEWHRLLLDWVNSNTNGVEAPFLPPPYNWKTYGDMNVMLWKKHQGTAYEKSKELLRESHAEIVELVGKFTGDEMFVKNVFPWVGGSTLGSYFVSVTSSHYDWATKKIKAQIKAIK